ncbi:MAG: type VI secretion system-associated protein VasI [Halomonadaceae bacterium]|uniref:Type VI secretion system-associated protein TagO n=1 Tax=Halomonas colorata TaxID=2742615 RepID=A0ABR9G1J9_9GAMM|nr:type VI secretion system-associated protein VasI [Halomonas colorata]MBE0464735.1 type VI secretion system-associated protein TagO [Halomonas colorata]
MNMILRKHGLAMLIALCAGSVTTMQATANDQALLDAAHTCAQENSRLDRLSCYDQIFLAPEKPDNDGSALPALWDAIARQESQRTEENTGLLFSEQGEDVLMSAPALGTTPPRPTLVIACEKWITRFQLHLPEPIEGTRVEVQLSSSNRSINQQWRIRNDGHVISGGRGLPAIETLRQLLNASDLRLQSDVAALDGLRFDVTGLNDMIDPLRENCGW